MVVLQDVKRNERCRIRNRDIKCNIRFIVMPPHANMRSDTQKSITEKNSSPPLFPLSAVLHNPPPLLCYSIICWLVVNYYSVRERDICHQPGLTCGSPSRGPRQGAATRETTAHHQSLSLWSDPFSPTPTCISSKPEPAPYLTFWLFLCIFLTSLSSLHSWFSVFIGHTAGQGYGNDRSVLSSSHPHFLLITPPPKEASLQ